MKRKILGVFVTVMFGCMVLSGCKKNVGTPEDNAVVEMRTSRHRIQKHQKGTHLATAALIFIIHIMML